MTRPVYSQMNTLVRVKEARMLTRAQKLSLIHAADITAVLKQLSDLGYFTFAPVVSASDYQAALTSEKTGWLSWAKELSPIKPLSDWFMLRDTVTCLKGMLTQRLTGKQYQPTGDMVLIYPVDSLKLLAQDNPTAKELFGQDWISAVQQAAEEYTTNGLFGMECCLDRFHIEQLLKTAEAIDESGIKAYTFAYADIYHLSVLLQSRLMDIKPPRCAIVSQSNWKSELPGLFSLSPQEQDTLIRSGRYAQLWDEHSSGDNAALFNVKADNFLLEMCKTAKIEAFGLYPMFGFMTAKLTELADLHLILSGMSWKLNADEIEKRMRECYEL